MHPKERLTELSPSVLLSSLELSGTKVYEFEIRDRLGTAAHFCEVVVLKLKQAGFVHREERIFLELKAFKKKICIERMTSGRKPKVPREGSK